MKIAFILLLLSVSACTTPPLQYKNVVLPQAVYSAQLQSDRPVVALALGSGGDRGFAHIGVIKVLEANNIKVDLVLGTSAGSVVGALYAGGYDGVALEKLALEMDREKLKDFDFSRRGYVRGEQLQDFINRALKNRSIEQLDKPFVAIATQLSSGRAVAFNRGNTGMAVRASSSIPGVFYPVIIQGEEYVDGDLKKPVPVTIAREMGADFIIAVDISQQPKDSPALLDIIDILKQSLRIMRQSILSQELASAQVVIRPVIGMTPEIDAASKLHLIKAGEEAATAALPMIREWLQKIAAEKALEQHPSSPLAVPRS
ncbi:patatin-like phospholipase family protein [Gallionella capsiferriformans]|jgi:NTE family protein|uniref:Patatin n=1 Tax=Gallionella capsiferriformans (strain ES-2) TaxID=395494 RepID=D9SJS8_GALCS|nr:patatin-like phospholipase family protein [Gallionella capsiferriformans]ADL54427.1 Patatin [Gallionella capsiferriformans ES-2]